MSTTPETQAPGATTPAPQQQQQEEQRAQQQEAESAFSAGFNDETAPATKPKAEDPTKKATTPAAPAAATPAATPAATTPKEGVPPSTPAQKFAGFTEDEIKRLLQGAQMSTQERERFERQFKQINGWIGSINDQLKKLVKPASATPTASASPRELNSETMKKLKEDLPDVFQALQELVGTMPAAAAGGPSKEEIEQLVAGRVQSAVGAFQAEQEKREQSRLFKAHPELREMAAKAPKGTALLDLLPDFKLWLAAQPAAYQAEIRTAEDAETVSAALTKFKQSRTAAAAPTEEQKRKAEEERQRKERQEQRLETAITPTGVPAQGPQNQSAEQAFIAGFTGSG